MKIALLHYHLKTGGVTSVLKRQVSALQGECEILVLTGDRADTELPCPVMEIPGLGYDQPDISPPSPETTAERILKALSHMWPGGCDVLHIHNPTLAKSQHLIRCIRQLQVSGMTLFLQIHDFAEDGRPGAYTQEAYPADCHYGVINTRDRRILLEAGLTPSGVHLIPNAIYPLPTSTGDGFGGLALYPVRAIRRKNIGEAVLLSLYMKPGRYIGVTQPPNSRQDMGSYLDWRAYVKKKGLKLRFDLGQRHDFSKLAGGASFMITTSITEGFGFSFLEPWTAGKALQGRRLGSICADFEENGLCLASLYDRLHVPLAWFDADEFFQTRQRAVMMAAEKLGYCAARDEMDRCAVSMARDGVVDFGLLHERHQRQVISHLLSNSKAKNYLISLNPRMGFPGPNDGISEMIENNRRVVATHYDSKTYQEKLLSIYHEVVDHPVRQHIDKQKLVAAFFDLERFSLLKWGAYAA